MGLRWLKRIAEKKAHAANISVPSGYRTTTDWVPAIGDIAPGFKANSTIGPLDFFYFAEGKWTFLFNQPNAGGAVCTTELAMLSTAYEDFQHRNCNLLCVTQETVQKEAEWVANIERSFPTKIRFPLVADPQFEISKLFGMSHWKQEKVKAVRKTYLIDPSLKVAGIIEYPLYVGRSVHEMLRMLDANLEHRANGVVTPVDWQAGDPALVPNFMGPELAQKKWGGRLRTVAPGVTFVEDADEEYSA